MKKVALIIICVFSLIVLSSCTDNTKEYEQRLETEKLLETVKAIEPTSDGKIKDIDPDDDGEG